MDNYYKISPTAIMNAKTRRDCTNMSYAKEIADIVEKKQKEEILKWRYPILKLIARLFPNLFVEGVICEARPLSVNKAIEEFGDCSILELATGLSPRSLELVKLGRLYIETDLDEIIELKKEIIEEIRKKEGLKISKKHYFLSLNPLNMEELNKIGEIYKNLEEKSPLVVIHEGLYRYFNKEEQIKLRDNIYQFLKKYSSKGAWITPDLMVKAENKSNWIIRSLSKNTERKTGRGFTYFDSREEIKEFLEEGGFKVELVPNDSIINEMTCIDKMDFDKNKVREVIKAYRAYIIRLN